MSFLYRLTATIFFSLVLGICSASAQTTNCPSLGHVGYRVVNLNGVATAVWYPTSDPESTYRYAGNGVPTTLAPSGAMASECGPFPLVLFSHGYTGCGT